MMKPILFLTLCCLYLLTPHAPALAEQTKSCHCFRDRSYDPARKFAADDYLLASSFNSLIAATLGVSKRQIVMMKMKGGVDPDELLAALYIADRTKSPVDILLSIRDNGGSWQSIVNAPALQAENSSDPVVAKIAAGMAEKDISSLVTDAMLTTYYQAQPEKIDRLRSQKLSNRELGLLFALNRQTGTSMQKIIAMIKEQKMSWSEVANSFDLTPAGVGKAILAGSSS